MLYHMFSIAGAFLIGILIMRRLDLKELNRMSRKHSEDLLQSNLENYTIGWQDADQGVPLDSRYEKYKAAVKAEGAVSELAVTYASPEEFLEILKNADTGILIDDPRRDQRLLLQMDTPGQGAEGCGNWHVYGPDPEDLRFNYVRFMEEVGRLMPMNAEERKKTIIRYFGIRA